jgi:hypothetical protein
LFYAEGQYDRALPMYEECLAKQQRVLGDKHPDIKTTQRNPDLNARHAPPAH